MQTCLLSARCFCRGFHRKPSFDLNRQAHRCRLSTEGQTYLLKSTIDQHSKHVACRHRRPRTLFLRLQTDSLRKLDVLSVELGTGIRPQENAQRICYGNFHRFHPHSHLFPGRCV